MEDTVKMENAENVEESKKMEEKVSPSILEKVQKAMVIDENSRYQQVPTKEGSMTEIVKKQYKFVEPQGNRSQIAVYDIDVITSIDKIHAAMEGRKYLNYIIAKEFSNLNESEKYKAMGFKTIAELGKCFFGLESSTVNHYAKIGKYFLDNDYNVVNGLPELSISHYIELSKLVDEETGDTSAITNLYVNGTLVDGMSTKDIRKALVALEDKSDENADENADSKGADDKGADDKGADDKGADASATKISNETPIETLSAEFDKQIVVGQIVSNVARVSDLFKLLNEKDIKIDGYGQALDTLYKLAMDLLQA